MEHHGDSGPRRTRQGETGRHDIGWPAAARQRAQGGDRTRRGQERQYHVLIYRRPCTTQMAHKQAQTRRVLGSAEKGRDKTKTDSKAGKDETAALR